RRVLFRSRVGPREIPDRNRGRRGRAERGEEVASDNGAAPAGIGIEEEDRGLMVGEALRLVPRPVAAGLQAEMEIRAVEAGLEPVERVGMADGLADDREV